MVLGACLDQTGVWFWYTHVAIGEDNELFQELDLNSKVQILQVIELTISFALAGRVVNCLCYLN